MEAPDRQMTAPPGVAALAATSAASASASASAAASAATTAMLPADANHNHHGHHGHHDAPPSVSPANKKKARRGADTAGQKRRCVSTACIACRKRKSKCDGASPKCAACESVYGTECVYDPGSDHRRKGVYREKLDSVKARSSTLQILIEAILNAGEDEVAEVVRRIRTCENLDVVAEQLAKQDLTGGEIDYEDAGGDEDYATVAPPDAALEGERDLARKMGELRLENDSVRFIGGTSHLIYLGDPGFPVSSEPTAEYHPNEDPITSWTDVTKDTKLIIHLMNMYFTYHYTFFTTLSKSMFYRDFLAGRAALGRGATVYCSSLLVNTMLALGCHFTNVPGAFAVQGDSRTKGDHFFAEAKRIITANDEYEKPRLTTVQALALMSVREAGCGREAKGWVYSGMSFRMAQDIGLNLDITGGERGNGMSEHEIDARRITFWGCFVFDKAWSNYLGRLPQLPQSACSVPKYDVFPDEDAEKWSPYRDDGFDTKSQQPSRTRAVGLQLLTLNEISSDLLLFFYHPHHIQRPRGKAAELKKLSELHRRLEDWRRELPKELEPKEGQLPNVILVHMFFHLQYLHLFKPFLKYNPSSSPLPPHVSPRRICTANAGAISKLMRLYKKNWGLRQICNIAVYMVHSSCIIHLLNLPDRTAKRDITHGVRHLEEIAEDWLCARRTLSILSVLARKWRCELPEEAAAVLQRTDEKYGAFSMSEVPSPMSTASVVGTMASPTASVSEVVMPIAKPQPNQLSNPPSGMFVPGEILPGSGSSGDVVAAGVSPATSISLGSPIPVTGPSTTPQSIDLEGSSWAPPMSMPIAANYPHTVVPFAPERQVGPSAHNNSRPFSPTSVQHRSPPSMDGQDWFMHDGVKWQQNFEPWGNAGSAQPQGQAQGQVRGQVQGQVQGPIQGQAGVGSATMGGNGMFVYRDAMGRPMSGSGSAVGLEDGGYNMGAFDGLHMTSMGWGGLAGLE